MPVHAARPGRGEFTAADRIERVTPDDLAAALFDLVVPLAENRRAGAGAEISRDDVILERPRNRDHGDWSSNVAMRIAKRLGANPRELATDLAAGLAAVPGVATAEVAGPGFLNVRLDAAAHGEPYRRVTRIAWG